MSLLKKTGGLVTLCAALTAVFASANASTSAGRSLRSEELETLFGGIAGKQCGAYPPCNSSCNINIPVMSCTNSTNDPGTCANETTDQGSFMPQNQKCIIDAMHWNCFEGAYTAQCRIYYSCTWDLTLQACALLPGNSPCFPMPATCDFMQAP